MNRSAASDAEKSDLTTGNQVLNWLLIAALVYLLLVGTGVISSGFREAVDDQAAALFAFAKNPVAGLILLDDNRHVQLAERRIVSHPHPTQAQ